MNNIEKEKIIETINLIKDVELLKKIGKFIFDNDPNIEFSENNNGIFINVSNQSDDFFLKIKDFL
jgi:hypothetical protein